MPAVSKKTAKKIARMIELHGQGKSAREIAEDIKITDRTAATWLRDKGLDPNGGAGPRASRRRVPGAAAVPRGAVLGAALALAAAETDPVTEDTPLEIVAARLRMVRRMITALESPVQAGDYDPIKWSALVKLERELAAAVVELTPVAAPDPERDPANLEAAAAVKAKLERLVAHAERETVCSHCGLHPFAKMG